MNIAEMAREADLIDDTSASDWYVYRLERFAELVRADERNSWPAEMEAMERQVNILTDALAEQRKPLPKNEWPKHPSPYWNGEYLGFSKSDLTDYAMQVLAAHGIKENT